MFFRGRDRGAGGVVSGGKDECIMVVQQTPDVGGTCSLLCGQEQEELLSLFLKSSQVVEFSSRRDFRRRRICVGMEDHHIHIDEDGRGLTRGRLNIQFAFLFLPQLLWVSR